MRVTMIHAPGDVRLEDRPDPTITAPTDAIIRTVATCVCGSDLWPYRGARPVEQPNPIGHEAVGVVEAVGSSVSSFVPGDFVIAPFIHCDNTCATCATGMTAACPDGDFMNGAQGEYVHIVQADGSLVKTDGMPDDDMIPALLTLSDVMSTGWHAAVSAEVQEGGTVAVVGDGAVGLSGILAAKQMGAERIIAMSRHQSRQQIARTFGATDIVPERGEEGEQIVLDMTDGLGADSVLECVGTEQSLTTAFAIARSGSTVGFVGVPNYKELPIGQMFRWNKGLAGGIAPVRTYLRELLDKVLAGEMDPSPVFDTTMPLDDVADAYRAMDERKSIKVLLTP